MAKKGYVNVSINYRLYGPGLLGRRRRQPVGCIQAMIDAQHDAQAAVRFLRKNAATYRIDPNRIAIGGTSAGAITALHVGRELRGPGHQRQPGLLVRGPGVRSRSPGRRCSAPPMSSTDAPDPDVPRHRRPARAVPVGGQHARPGATPRASSSYLTTYQGEGHVPFNHDEQIFAQKTNFLYWMIDLDGAPG